MDEVKDNNPGPKYADAPIHLPIASRSGLHFSQVSGSSKVIPIFIPDDPPSDDNVDDGHTNSAYTITPSIPRHPTPPASTTILTKGKTVHGKSLSKSSSKPEPAPPTQGPTLAANTPSRLDYIQQRRHQSESWPASSAREASLMILSIIEDTGPKKECAARLDEWVAKYLGAKKDNSNHPRQPNAGTQPSRQLEPSYIRKLKTCITKTGGVSSTAFSAGLS